MAIRTYLLEIFLFSLSRFLHDKTDRYLTVFFRYNKEKEYSGRAKKRKKGSYENSDS